MNEIKKYAVIVAGGSGTRMGYETPKQFLLLQNKTILWHSINAFFSAFHDIEIIVVLPNTHLNFEEEIKKQFVQNTNQITCTIGGATRFESVKNGLSLIKEAAVIFVHDAVRCLVSKKVIENCLNTAIVNGCAIPVVAATDSIRIKNKVGNKAIDRNEVKIVQTPQTFLSSILIPAFQQKFDDKFTDEASVVEAFGKTIYLCEGDYENIKITRPIDLIIAEEILKQRQAN